MTPRQYFAEPGGDCIFSVYGLLLSGCLLVDVSKGVCVFVGGCGWLLL